MADVMLEQGQRDAGTRGDCTDALVLFFLVVGEEQLFVIDSGPTSPIRANGCWSTRNRSSPLLPCTYSL